MIYIIVAGIIDAIVGTSAINKRAILDSTDGADRFAAEDSEQAAGRFMALQIATDGFKPLRALSLGSSSKVESTT